MRWMHAWVWSSALGLLACSPSPRTASAVHADMPRRADATPAATLEGLPWEQRVGLERAMAEDDPRHAPTVVEGAPALTAGGVSASFGDTAELRIGEHTAHLRAVALGRGDARTPLARTPSRAVGAEVRAERAPGIVEWWRSIASGLEHGVTIERRPAGEGELTLEVQVSGLGVRSAGSDTVELTADDHVVATYAHLVVTDARGDRVPARMAAHDGAMTIAVDDEVARYPLVIDPLVVAQEADLLATPLVSARFGRSVAATADGSRVVVGVSSDSVGGVDDVGSVRVFVRTGVTWREEAVLVPTGGEAGDAFGYSVAVTPDGTRALVGARGDDTAGGADAGSAYVFVRAGTTWTVEATLTPLDGAAGDLLGTSVDLSNDGSRALVGATNDTTAVGASAGSARVFVRTGTSWAEEASLSALDGAAGDELGTSVALSADGSRALIGAWLDDDAAGNAGSARVFVRTGSAWAQEAVLLAPDAAAGDQFGQRVALSDDATRALVSAPKDNTVAGTDAGSVRVFVRTGSVWAQEATLLAVDGAALDQLGGAVDLSADGATAIAGSFFDDTAGGTDAGSAHVYVRAGSMWTEQATLTASDGADLDQFGTVTLTDDGTRAFAGVLVDDTPVVDAGSVRVFLRSGATWGAEAVLVASDGAAAGDQLGNAVALSGDGTRCLVGAWTDNTAGGTDAGSARVFVRVGTTWTLEALLVPSDGSLGDLFGTSVALDQGGSTAVIGAQWDDTAAGAEAGTARVFVRTGSAWIEQATLSAVDGGPNDYFGHAVALSADGDTVLVGVVGDNTAGGTDAGSARVFVRSGATWSEAAMLTAADGAPFDAFGGAVALSRDASHALVGAPRDDTSAGVDGGSAHVFARAGAAWTEEPGIVPIAGAAGDVFGAAVALDRTGTRALVGANSDETIGGSRAGSARVFLRTGSAWAQEDLLFASDGAPGDGFGDSVALNDDGTRALIGAPSDDLPGAVNAGSAMVAVRRGTAWSDEARLTAPGGAASDQFANGVALDGDGLRALLGALFDDTASGADAGSARVFTLQATAGTPCSSTPGCVSGFCVDGVCCDTPCGDGALDCQACSVGAGGAVDGTCGPLRAMEAAAVVCRPGTDLCDAPEVCMTGSTMCPPDALHGSGHECRGAAGGCDAPEVCDGASAACPVDVIRGSGEVCRTLAGICDQAELCDGVSVDCPADAFVAASTVCRASAGGCDVAEACDGATANCPGDLWLPAGTVCGVGMGTCAMPAVCSGLGVLCGSASGVRPAGTVCRTSAGTCDVEDVCDGSSEMCPDAFEPATTECGGTPSGVCDAQDHCTGTSADCMPTFLAGVECRGSTGGCDPAEVCGGGAADCPPDAISPSGTVCRAASMACDLAESCDGTTAACPADQGTCGDGDLPDGGATDAGTPPPPVQACSCAIAPRVPAPWLLLVLGALLAAARLRRR